MTKKQILRAQSSTQNNIKFDNICLKWYNIDVAFKGGNKLKMKNDDKASISLKKIICISILFIFVMTAAVVAGNVKLNNVKIILASGYEMNVLTSKTKIADILDDNHIILLEDEKVSPDLESELSDNNTIKISKITDEEIEAPEVIETSETITMEEVLKNYDTIIEKIVVEKVKIPFETVTKNKASGSGSKQNQIIQYGVNGIKEVTYKVKYQNDVEISRNAISEEVLREPVSRIVRVQARTTSRAMNVSRTSDNGNSDSGSGNVKVYKVTAYCACAKCCGGHANGYTASGTKATQGRTVAAPSNLSFGTKLIINGKEYVVEDRGGAIKGNRIDVYVSSHAEALRWGVKYLPVEVGK